jgi:hypothetical protein
MNRFFIAAIVTVAFLFGFQIESFAKESPAKGVKTVAAKRTMKKKRTRKYRRHVRKHVRHSKRTVKKSNTPKAVSAKTTRVKTSDFGLANFADVRPVSATVAFEFAGLVAQPDGSNAKLWHSREFTTDTKYAYVGKMKFGAEWVHVWMESEVPAALVASVTPTEPAVEEGTETFPDGGAGIVEVAADDPLAMAREQEEINRTVPEDVQGVPEGKPLPTNGKPGITILPSEAPITNAVPDPNLKPIQVKPAQPQK